MELTLEDLTIDLNKIDVADILSCWSWALADVDMDTVFIVSCLGDIFFIGEDKGVYWLQCDCGDLSKIAEDRDEFADKLSDCEYYENIFLPELVIQLKNAGKTLKENQIYSYKVMPVLGGEYSVDNIEPIDISVHFSLSGQICEQIKDLPNETEVNIVVKK
jgi:hypothetical protein